MGRWRGLIIGVVIVAVYENWPQPMRSEQLNTWVNSGKYFSYQGHQIFYKVDKGLNPAGGVLVTLHGFPSFSYDWSKVWNELMKQFDKVIALDFIGFGFSDKPTGYNYTIVEQANIVEALLKMLHIKNVHLLAHDYGDTVAQELLSRYEEQNGAVEGHMKLKTVCLSNGGVFPETNHPRPVQKLLLMPILGSVLSRLTNYYIFKRGFGDVFGSKTQPTDEEFTDFWASIRHNDGYAVTPGLIQYIPQRWANRERWVGVLKNPTVPVHMIYGPADPVNKYPEFPNLYQDLVPNGSIDILEDHISHYPQLEDPKAFVKSYVNFLNKVRTNKDT